MSTIAGVRKNASGIINNEIYIGRMVWNRQSFAKNPDTGKRVRRINPREEWVITEVPELQIIDKALWDKVKAGQKTMAFDAPLMEKRRPKALFSYLLKCA